jgi:hypothetical protein
MNKHIVLSKKIIRRGELKQIFYHTTMAAIFRLDGRSSALCIRCPVHHCNTVHECALLAAGGVNLLWKCCRSQSCVLDRQFPHFSLSFHYFFIFSTVFLSACDFVGFVASSVLRFGPIAVSSKQVMDHYNTNSYQNAPQIKHLDAQQREEAAGSSGSNSGSSIPWFGRRDATLEPNTGLTNSYDYALFGLALHELLDRLRYSIIGSSIWLFLVIFFTWWTRLVRPVGLFLSVLLAILAFVLLVVEVSSLFRAPHHLPNAANAAAGSSIDLRRPKLTELIDQTEQIGLVILFHPVCTTTRKQQNWVWEPLFDEKYSLTCFLLCFVVALGVTMDEK